VVVRVAFPTTVVASVDRLLTLVVALLVKILATARRIEAATATNVAFHLVRWARRQLVPLDTCERRVLCKQCSRQELVRCLCHTLLRERLEAGLSQHARGKVLSRHVMEHAIIAVHRLLAIPTALLLRFFLEQGTDTDATGFRTEMSSKSISTSKSPATAPIVTVFQVTAANKFLLARMQSLMSLAIMLAGECFAADTAYEWTLIGVSAQVRPQIVSSREAFWTQIALKCRGMLLRPLGIGAICWCRS
jgi:hypothetical protein